MLVITGRAVVVAFAISPLSLSESWGQVSYFAWAIWGVAVVIDRYRAVPTNRLVLTRSVPTSMRVGEPSTCTVQVENSANRPARLLLRDAWPPSVRTTGARTVMQIPAHASANVTTELLPEFRGQRSAGPVTIRSFGPWGLAGRQTSQLAPASALILPRFGSRRLVSSLISDLETGTKSRLRTPAAGSDIDMLRDYVPGDDVRQIDWVSSARKSTPVVRVLTPERHRHITVVIDTGRTSAALVSDAPRLDTYLDATMLLAALVVKAGDTISLTTMSNRLGVQVRSINQPSGLHKLHENLAEVDAHLVESDLNLWRQALLSASEKPSLVVIFASLGTSSADSVIGAVAELAAHHRIIVVSVTEPISTHEHQPPQTSQEVYQRAAEVHEALEVNTAIRELETLGVTVISAAPSTCALELSRAYIDLKSRQLL